MRDSRKVETWVGVFVALGLAALFALAMKVSDISAFQRADGYEIVARFNNVGGLKPQAPVNMAGVLVGRVASIRLDETTYEAEVVMTIFDEYDRLPEDTSAAILTAGLLGEQYIGLEPGGLDMYLGDGDEITLTQSALVLEQIIGQFLYSQGEGN